MEAEDRYNWEQFDLPTLMKKKHPFGWFAYMIAYNRDMEKYPGRDLNVSIILDCDGAPVPGSVSKQSSSPFCQLCPGAEWAYPNYTVRYAHRLNPRAGTIIDHRNWLMIILGCCPPLQW